LLDDYSRLESENKINSLLEEYGISF